MSAHTDSFQDNGEVVSLSVHKQAGPKITHGRQCERQGKNCYCGNFSTIRAEGISVQQASPQNKNEDDSEIQIPPVHQEWQVSQRMNDYRQHGKKDLVSEQFSSGKPDQAAQGKPQIRIGIGIATGAVIAGYTGTIRRATYTCVGDTVNLAARLEAHTKLVGQPILIDEVTRQGLSRAIRIEEQGKVQLKGKVQEVEIFTVPVIQS